MCGSTFPSLGHSTCRSTTEDTRAPNNASVTRHHTTRHSTPADVYRRCTIIAIAATWVHATVRVVNQWGKTGSGFLVYRTLDDSDRSKVFLVTNKHVVNSEKARRHAATSVSVFVNVKGSDGTVRGASFPAPLLANGQKQWREHPDEYTDVFAVDITPLIQSHPEIVKKWAGYDLFATPEILKREEITTGEEIMVIGYPLGLSHADTNSPLVRQGIIATRIGEAINITIRRPDGKPAKIKIRGFMIDSGVAPGSSGSPVVLKPVIGRIVANNVQLGNQRPYLLGIIASAAVAAIEVEGRAFPTLAGLGIVYDASTIRKTIELFFN